MNRLNHSPHSIFCGESRNSAPFRPHPLIFGSDVVREERDARGPWLRRLHLAEVDPGTRTERAHLDPVSRPVRRALDRGVGLRLARSDVRDVERKDVAIPANRLAPIGDDDRDRVDAEDGHGSPGEASRRPTRICRARCHRSVAPWPYIFAYHSITSWSEIRWTSSSTARSFSASHASTVRRAEASPSNSVTTSCHFRRRALKAATTSGPSKTT